MMREAMLNTTGPVALPMKKAKACRATAELRASGASSVTCVWKELCSR